ncbi:MAG: hypothetical protein FJW88_03290 [Actinobacteria bacterium]|nr:hypothetical protein [Actinomycetota bacterium]
MTVTYQLDGAGVARVRMDDGKANVLGDASCTRLREAMARAAEDRAAALVLEGRDGMFSGGIDREVLRDDDAVRRAATLAHIAHTLLAVWTAPIPTVAAVTGHAIAGGAILAMACDRRIGVGGSFKLGVNESMLGMVLPTWAMAIIEGTVPTAHRTEVMLMGCLFDPAGAARVGILDEVVAADGFDDAVREAATGLAEVPTRAYAGNKRMLRGARAEVAAALVAAEMGPGFAKDARTR